MTIRLNPKQILRYFIALIFLLLLANLTAIIVKLNYLDDNGNSIQSTLRFLIRLFDFNSEKSIPTFYSSFALLLCSLLLLGIGINSKNRGSKYLEWIGLSFIFVFLSIDEMLAIHELLVDVTKKFVSVSGLLYYAWVIPYSIGLLVLTMFYYKFLKQLPKKTFYMFFLSGFVFVSGAIGIESIGGLQHQVNGTDNLTYCLLYTLEELLEMVGVVIFIYAILCYQSFSISLKINNN